MGRLCVISGIGIFLSLIFLSVVLCGQENGGQENIQYYGRAGGSAGMFSCVNRGSCWSRIARW
jgi:hypothetical protein